VSSESFTVNLRQAATNGARRPAGTLQQSGLVAALLQQIHDDLRIQHPEWVQPNGESQHVILTRRASWNCSTLARKG